MAVLAVREVGVVTACLKITSRNYIYINDGNGFGLQPCSLVLGVVFYTLLQYKVRILIT